MEMTDEDVVIDFAEFWDLKVTKLADKSKPGSPRKQCWRAATGARDKIFEIVCDIYPYMGERRRARMDEFLTWYADTRKNK